MAEEMVKQHVLVYGSLAELFPIKKPLFDACRKAGLSRAQALWWICQRTVHFDLKER